MDAGVLICIQGFITSNEDSWHPSMGRQEYGIPEYGSLQWKVNPASCWTGLVRMRDRYANDVSRQSGITNRLTIGDRWVPLTYVQHPIVHAVQLISCSVRTDLSSECTQHSTPGQIIPAGFCENTRHTSSGPATRLCSLHVAVTQGPSLEMPWSSGP